LLLVRTWIRFFSPLIILYQLQRLFSTDRDKRMIMQDEVKDDWLFHRLFNNAISTGGIDLREIY
jgi:hypothetical protein